MSDRAVRSRRHTSPRPPWQLSVPAALAIGFLVLPLAAIVARAPWASLDQVLRSDVVADALRLSLLCSTAAAAICVVLGIPLAWILARTNGILTTILRALVTVPLVLPPVVGGVALLSAFGRTGMLGRPIDEWFGITLPFTTAGVIFAEAFVAMPFLILTVEGALRTLDPGMEDAAATLGASRLLVFRRITLPAMLPAVLAGTALAWARALGEFGATITFAGNFPGRTQTMPLAVYLAMERDPDAAVALSLILLLVAVAMLIFLRGNFFRVQSR